VRYELNLYLVMQKKVDRLTLCGGGLEYLHRCLANRKRRQKGNPLPGGIDGPPCSWGIYPVWRRGKKNWSQVPDGRLTPRQTGRPAVGRKLTSTSSSTSTGGYKYENLALQVGGVSNETVKYGREFCGTLTQEWLLWQSPEAIVQ
jgi:hypothetical protein